jgi:4-amino-4-deoxy-L-arabinose transferase-like glycosyltransferase
MKKSTPRKLPLSLTMLILIALTCFGFLLRIWWLEKVPAILNRDEAALAYNAVLLKETGKDEWGKSWPLSLESFGDYKLPGYPYLLVVFFRILGTSDVVVRFPSVLAGTALIPLMYFFVRKTLNQKEKYALFAGLLIAIQPVFFFYSRIAFEANVALSIFVLSLILFLSTKKYWVQFLGAVFLLISVFTYNTPLLLLPFLIPVFIYWGGVKNWKKWIIPVLGSVVICIIGFSLLISLAQQKSGITIFSDESTWMQSVEFHNQFQGINQKIFGNKVVFYGMKIGQNYLNSFSAQFLVQKGGSHPWHTLPGFGHLYWITYLLAFLGILISVLNLIKSLRRKDFAGIKQPFTLLYLLFVSLLPAAITVDAPHATRSLFFFFLLIVFAAVGIREINQLMKLLLKREHQKIIHVCLILVLGLVLGGESLNYFSSYFRNYPTQSHDILHGGFADVLSQASQKDSGSIAIIDGDGYQYILTAWYARVSPEVFFQTVQKHLPDKIGFRYGYKVAQYRFIAHEQDRFEGEKTIVEWDDVAHSWIVKDFN